MPRKSGSSTLFYADDFDMGLRTDISADKAPEGSLVVANNVRFIPGGGFGLRRGVKEMDWAPGTSAKIEQFGKCLEHDVLFVRSGTKIQQTIDETTLYDVGWVGTAGYRGKFREYNSEMKYSNGEDIYLSITVGTVLTQFTNSDTTIVVGKGHADQFITPLSKTFTANAGNDQLSATNTPNNGDRVMFTTTDTLPAGLSTGTVYFVRNRTSSVFQVSLTPTGSVIDITDTGTGTHTFTTGILYCKGQVISYTSKKSQAFTADAANDTITSASHGLENGAIINVSNSGGALPTGLSAATDYYVINATDDTFQVSTVEYGAAVDITGAGSGTHTFEALRGGDTFNGCTIPSGTYEVGSVVTQLRDVPNAPKATVIETIFEKMVASGSFNAGHVMHYTETANADDPRNIDSFSGSGADSELFGKYGTVTAMETLLTKMYVAKQKGIETWSSIDADGIPVRDIFDNSYGVVNHDCLIPVGNRLMMLADTRRIKTIEPDNTGANPEPIINPYFDEKITGTLRLLDFDQTEARMGYNERDQLARITCEQESLLQTIIFDTETNGFSIDTGYNPSCWIEWRGSTYFGDAYTDKIYKAETGFKDAAAAPNMRAVTPQHFVGDRRRKTTVDQIFLTGLIKEQTTAYVDIYCDGMLHRTVGLTGDADYVSKTVFRPLGRNSIGYDPLGLSGGDPSEDDGFEFAVPIDVNFECRYIQIVFRCQGEGFGFQIDSYEGVASETSSSTATQIDAI